MKKDTKKSAAVPEKRRDHAALDTARALELPRDRRPTRAPRVPEAARYESGRPRARRRKSRR